MRSRAQRLLGLALLAAVGAAGCGKRPEPVGELGTFHVRAEAAEHACGDGALGLADTWSFDVELAREDGELLWDNGYDVVVGALEDDERSFSFEVAFDQDMRTEEDPAWLPPCSIRRTDTASGALSSATDDVRSFDGELRYAFEATEGSDCRDLVGVVFAKLPCSVTYGIDGERTRAPGEDGALDER